MRNSRLMTRRGLLTTGVAFAAAGALPALASAQDSDAAAQVSVEELMQPGPLPELTFGRLDAPITLVEYASMTCPYCAAFHNTVLPTLRQKYISTGKLRWVLREFPLDNLAAAASMLGRCAGQDKTFALIAVLYLRQNEWAFVPKPLPELFRFAKLADFTKASFDECLRDQKLLDNIAAIRARGSSAFGVAQTPTFFVNGKRLNRGATLEDFEKAFEPFLKS
jgi:protein-disulfide isomerase